MPSDYSTDLRIELIANGEKTGTWGTITNDNLGVIIEDAIAGLVTYTTAVQKYPLTAQYGAADQARCAALAIDTSYAGNFEIYVPPVTKLYVFKNTNGTYNATVYCSATIGGITPPVGATGVTVPPGKTVLLRADGTNVVEQLNHFVGNMSFGGNATVTGDFSVAGNATFVTQSPGDNTTKAATTAFVTATTSALGTMSTQNANNVNITGGTMSGMTSIADTIGNVRNIPLNSKTSSYVLLASDTGQLVSITTGGVTVPSGVFSSGQAVSVYNNSGTSQTITQGGGVTMRLAAIGSTGNRTLEGYGLCFVMCVGSNDFVITGAGIS